MTKTKTPDREVEGFECLRAADIDALITETIRSQVLSHHYGIPRHLTGLIGALHYGEAAHG